MDEFQSVVTLSLRSSASDDVRFLRFLYCLLGVPLSRYISGLRLSTLYSSGLTAERALLVSTVRLPYCTDQFPRIPDYCRCIHT
jgi:hypothetical protein